MVEDEKKSICRLCLSGNGSLVDIFHSNVINGCVPADVISELMQFEVINDNAYPHFACLECMGKLKEFKVFKEMCITSKDLLDRGYASMKGSGSEEIPIKNGICEDELTLRTLEVIAANATLLEPKKESEEYPLGGDNGSDDNLSCVSEWEEVPINPAPIPLKEVKTIDGDSENESADDPANNNCDDDRTSNVPEWVGVSEHPALVSLKEKQSVTEGSIEPTDDHCSTQTIEKDGEIPEEGREERKTRISTRMHKGDEGLLKKRLTRDISSKDYAKRSSVRVRQKTKQIPIVNWCNICGKIFSNELSLKTHKVTHEREVVRNFGCNECLRMFAELSKLGIHVRSHRGALPLPCPLCNVRFSVKCDLHKHFKTEHKGSMEVTYNCVDCESLKPDTQKVEPSAKESGVVESTDEDSFPSEDPWIEKGMVVKEDSKPFKCEKCGREYKTIRSLKKHSVIHTSKPRFECVECRKKYYDRYNLVLHAMGHSNVKVNCPICNKECKNEFSMKNHLKTHKERSLKCEKCGKAHRNRYELMVHMQSHDRLKIYECDVCHKKFHTKRILVGHKLVHSGGLPRKHKCPECDRMFISNAQLNSHMLRHRGVKPFSCEICGLESRSKDHIKRHMVSKHSGVVQERYQCEECGKSYTTKAALTRHKKEYHLGLKQYTCEHCDQAYTQKHNLVNHIKRVHSR